MDGAVFISDVTVTLNATDTESGVDHTMYKLDSAAWVRYEAPFVVSDNGTHTVLYYSVDKAGNIETTKNITFIVSHHAIFRISVKGGIGLTIIISNTGVTERFKIPWNITLRGGHLLIGKEGKSGTILQLNAGAEVTERLMVFGFGKITISVAAGTVETNATARVILFFVLG